MKKGFTIKRQFHLRRGKSNRQHVLTGAKPKATVGRVPRISRLMALAIRLDQLIRDGVGADQAELARLGHVSRARLSQVMNLLNLAPDIQESLLHVSPECCGRNLSERHLRPVAAKSSWKIQRRNWTTLTSNEPISSAQP